MSDSKFIKTLTIVLPVITAGLYLMGLTYNEGLLAGYGVEPSLFPLSSDIALLQGFFALIPIGMKPFLTAVTAIVLIFFMALLAIMLSSHALIKSVLAKIVAWLKKHLPPESASNAIDKISTAYLYFAGLVLLIILPFFVAILSYKSGLNSANINIDNYKSNKGRWVELYTADSKSPTKAQQITCSKTHCVFWLGSEALILMHDKIEKVVTHVGKVKK